MNQPRRLGTRQQLREAANRGVAPDVILSNAVTAQRSEIERLKLAIREAHALAKDEPAKARLEAAMPELRKP
jgi:hypothetical protein